VAKGGVRRPKELESGTDPNNSSAMKFMIGRLARVARVEPEEWSQVSGRIVLNKYDLFRGNLTLANSLCTPNSQVSQVDVCESALAPDDQTVTSTKDNMRGVIDLFEAFHVRDLPTLESSLARHTVPSVGPRSFWSSTEC
jgi:hypothetical protein